MKLFGLTSCESVSLDELEIKYCRLGKKQSSPEVIELVAVLTKRLIIGRIILLILPHLHHVILILLLLEHCCLVVIYIA